MKLNKIFPILGILAAMVILLFVIANLINANAIKEKQTADNYNEWLAENCKCLEKEKVSCPFGFKLKDNVCIGDTYLNNRGIYISSKLLDCSKYNCSGEIKSWDNSTNQWK
jgi:hypothetical protein